MSKTFIREKTKVEAIKWTGLNFREVTNFAHEYDLYVNQPGLDPTLLHIVSPKCSCYVKMDDWIVVDPDIQTVYSCDYDVFKKIFKKPEKE